MIKPLLTAQNLEEAPLNVEIRGGEKNMSIQRTICPFKKMLTALP
jgi:hypothetical protein